MKNSRLLTTALVLGLSVALFVAPACAWEFSMDGMFTWEYEVRGQLGSNGFFGTYDQAQAPGIGATLNNIGAYAPYNFYLGGYYKPSIATGTNATTLPAGWYGAQGHGGNQIVSGSDASWNTEYMSTNMQIRMNQAVRIRGNYYIGSWYSPNNSVSAGAMVASEYLNLDSPGVQRSFSPGYWNTLWLTAQLPWGEIALGKRPSSWGMGMAFNGFDNRTSESLALAVPYGPIRIQLSFYPSRRGYTATDDYGNTGAYFNDRPDKNNTRVFDMTVPQVVYNSGPLSAGAYLNWMFRHRGGESVIANPNTTVNGSRGIQARDYSEMYGGAYLKYNNGRFFLNTEYEFYRSTDRRSGMYNPAATSGTGTITPQIPPLYNDCDAFALEVGALCGPAKISLIGARVTGDDYQYSNTLIGGGQHLALVTNGKQPDSWSNTGVFRPYSYLMVYNYGLGTFFARDTGYGYVGDAVTWGGRLDYAVAANLNIFGSFFWAERASNSSYLWGSIRPAGVSTGTTNATNGQVVFANVDPVSYGNAVPVPTIPDGALGWEVDAGFDWKLLEALTARCTVGYWQPGKWWSYACIDKGVANWAMYNNKSWANNFGTNPGRTIDAVWGMEFKVEGNF